MTETQTYPNTFDARGVANKILHIANASDINLTSMQLIKLVYLAHGWSLVLFDRPIVKGNPEAWQYGPVYPSIYEHVKRNGSKPIRNMIKNDIGEAFFPNDISGMQFNFLQSILNSYGKWKAFTLSEITHREGTPWYRTFHEIGRYQEIPLDFMREHFYELAATRKINVDAFRNAESA